LNGSSEEEEKEGKRRRVEFVMNEMLIKIGELS